MNDIKDAMILSLYSLDETIAKDFLIKYKYPWEALADIKEYVLELGNSLNLDEYEKRNNDVWIHKTAKIYDYTTIIGPCIIGRDTEVRPGAFIRGSAIIGDNCVVGNSTEIKNVILFNNVQVPHYNYVGDSILGYKAHMGAGSITSNVKADKLNVVIKENGNEIITNRKKVGAFLGDFSEIGCNSVLNPGTVIGKNSNVYPLSCVRGVVPPDSIFKNAKDIIDKIRR